MAVGDAAGVLHLFELPRTLRRPLQNEKRLMEAFVAREAARVADVASRQVSTRLLVVRVGSVLVWMPPPGQQAEGIEVLPREQGRREGRFCKILLLANSSANIHIEAV